MLDAAARHQAQVVADIVASGSVDPVEDIEASVHHGVHASLFRAGHLAHIGDMPLRNEKQVTRVVRIEVERHYNMFTFAYDKAIDFFRTVADQAQDASVRLFPFEVAKLVEVEEVLH